MTNQPSVSDIRSAQDKAVGGGRKRCSKGKSCSATCIDPREYCLVELPESVGVGTSKVRNLVEEKAKGKKEPLTGAALEDAVKGMMREGIYSPEEWAKGTGYVLRNKRGDIKAFNKASEEAKAIVEAEKKRKRAEERRRPLTEEEKKQKEEEKAKKEEAKRQKEEVKKQKEEKEEREREDLLKKIPSEKETGLYPDDQRILRYAVETSDRILKKEYPEGNKDRANIEKLSPEERGAIFMYSAGGRGSSGKEEYWVALNQKMRYGEVRDDKSPETAAAVNFLEKNLRSALDNLPPARITGDQRLERAVSGRTAEQLKTLKPGDVFEDKGFGSYTTNGYVVDKFLGTPDSAVVRVVNPKKAKDISAGTIAGFGQQEHMYPGGSNFRVVKVEPKAHYNDETNENHTVIYVEEVD
jgi:hypothetical protein